MGQRRVKFSAYLRALRESRTLTQEELATRLGVTKYQISHIENSNRGASRPFLEKLITELRPTLREREELKAICEEENIGIDLPDALKGRAPLSTEMEHQKAFGEVHVVSARPIEITEIGPDNKFLDALAEDFKAFSQPPGRSREPRRRYVYWTVERSLPRFCTLLNFFEKVHGIRDEVLNEAARFVVAPEELCLLSFAIYSTP